MDGETQINLSHLNKIWMSVFVITLITITYFRIAVLIVLWRIINVFLVNKMQKMILFFALNADMGGPSLPQAVNTQDFVQ